MPPFVSKVFWIAAIYGLVVIPPQFFTEAKTGRDFPPAITHPEFYYGFLGVALAWQFAFILIARDPIRYRPVMIPGMLEKLTFGVGGVWLYLAGRVAWLPLAAGIVDLIFVALMFAAYQRTPKRVG